MKYASEFRNPDAVKYFLRKIQRITVHEWRIMEICGGQTHALLHYGIDELLSRNITLLHGPGCPVCVTPVEKIDKAIEIAALDDVIFCSFGDMLRVPGSRADLMSAKAKGGDVRIVYSPMDALKLAQRYPHKKVVFFAIGFETTAPAVAMTVHQARQNRVANFSALVSHVLVPPAMEFLLSSSGCGIQGFLAAGHVCTVMGHDEYIPLSAKYRIPIVVTGFEPYDLVQGLFMCVQQLEQGRFIVQNQYSRSVQLHGNPVTREWIGRVFEVVDQKWRGIGIIPKSGLALRQEYGEFDAERQFTLLTGQVQEPQQCISGQVLQGMARPPDCPCFAQTCTPEHPLGATMVSSEGACAAYYHYKSTK